MIPDYYSQLLSEERLLLSLCGTSFTDEQISQIRDLAMKVRDWDRFVFLANGHGIIALCWFNITLAGVEKYIPAGSKQMLQSGYFKTLARNTFLKSLFEEVSNLASRQGINIIGLKGIVLEDLIYGNRGLRHMSDIDILAEPQNALLLRKILLQNGFHSPPLISPLHGKLIPYLKAHLPPLEKNGCAIEIHVKLFDDRGNRVTEEIIKKAYKSDYPSGNVFWPPTQDLFLYLVKHIVNHENTKDLKLKSYLDLAVLAAFSEKEVLNEILFKKAKNVNLEEAVTEKLGILKIFWGAVFPGFIEERIVLLDNDRLAEKFKELIKNPVQIDPDLKLSDFVKPFRNIPGISNKLLFALGYLFPSVSYMKYHYGITSKGRILLFYPLRWLRILRLAAGEKGLKV